VTNDVIAPSLVQRGGLAALKLTKLFEIDDFPAAKDSGKVLIITIYCYLINYYWFYFQDATKGSQFYNHGSNVSSFKVTPLCLRPHSLRDLCHFKSKLQNPPPLIPRHLPPFPVRGRESHYLTLPGGGEFDHWPPFHARCLADSTRVDKSWRMNSKEKIADLWRTA